MVHLMEACLLTALQAYLLGSLLFGVLVSKLFYHDDVRLHGSGNAGMTNVLRTYGKLPAVITTIGDVGKSVVAVKLGQFIFDSLLSGTGADFQLAGDVRHFDQLHQPAEDQSRQQQDR